MAGPGATPSRSHGLLVCPAFAEEMNRARQTVRLLASEVMSAGFPVIYPDLHGTGDSDGDFGDARWEHWLTDLETAGNRLLEQGCATLSVLGIRAGALLAWDLLRRQSLPLTALVLWQPTLAGKSVVTDMLRTRLAGGVQQGTRETVAGLRERLAAGEPVEAAGYLLAPQLARALDACSIGPDPALSRQRLLWLEIVGDESSATRQPAQEMVKRLEASGAAVELRRQTDPPFWSTLEISVGRGAVATTTRWLAEAA